MSPSLDAIAAIIDAEIDVELSLRRRILDVLESRVQYAHLLQSSLVSSPASSAPAHFSALTEEFMSTLESPLTPVIYSQSLPLNPPVLPQPPRTNAALTSIKAKFLYVQVPSETDGKMKTFLLRCPQCSRTSFISLQGLLNHGRLAHQKEFSTHDSCIAECAVPFERQLLPADVFVGLSTRSEQDVLHLGNQVGQSSHGLGILPGLKRLFEMAVGVDGVRAFPRLESTTTGPTLSSNVPNEFDASSPTLVSQTLGHHVESPALAPFLGKKIKRRGIAVWGEDLMVDIDSDVDDRPHKPRWKMSFGHRNEVQDEEAVELMPVDEGHPEQKPGALAMEEQDTAQSIVRLEQPPIAPADNATRFYITARVILSDWSMWLPPENENHGIYSWMITLDSPAYATHHTAFLTYMAVTSASPAVVLPTTSTRTWPFYVRGYTSEPFLAHVTLGLPPIEGVEQKLVLEHWVDLDLLKSGYPAMGDEQIADLELDRRTVLREPLAADKGKLKEKVRLRAFWDEGVKSTAMEETFLPGIAMKLEEDWEYENVLRMLLPEFPMTLKDYKPGASRLNTNRTSSRRSNSSRVPKVPYKVLPSPKEFLALLHGRRKSIEWARAKALKEAYMAHISSLSQTKENTKSAPMPLTTADVYRWLEDEGEFPRPIVKLARPKATQPTQGISGSNNTQIIDDMAAGMYCATCGMLANIHPSRYVRSPSTSIAVKTEETSAQDTIHFVCDYIPPEKYKLAMVDVGAIIRWDSGRQYHFKPQVSRAGYTLFSQPRLLVESVDPRMTLAIKALVEKRRLPASSNFSRFTGTSFSTGASKNIAENLASYSLLAHLLPFLVKTIVNNALLVADDDTKILRSTLMSMLRTVKQEDPAKTSTESLTIGKRALTASHILRSLKSSHDETMNKLLVMMSPAGISTRLGDRIEGEVEKGSSVEDLDIEMGAPDDIIIKREID